MATETERKFLVKGNFKHLAVKKVRIVQSYLSVDPERTIRIRKTGRKAYIGIKSKPGERSITRGEWEYAIPYNDAGEIMKICLSGRIEKTRYFVPSGKHIIEVDVFHGKNEGLTLAEIELGSESEKFLKPAWLGKEVTGDPRYLNANLIR